MTNAITATVILIIVSLSIIKIVMEKRRGSKCIGCPHGGDRHNCNC